MTSVVEHDVRYQQTRLVLWSILPEVSNKRLELRRIKSGVIDTILVLGSMVLDVSNTRLVIWRMLQDVSNTRVVLWSII